MRQHLGLIAHVEQRSADRAFFEMIGPRFDLAAHRAQKGIDLELRKRHGLMM
jgi:hypothetical protein